MAISDHPSRYVPAAVVSYAGATETMGSRWRALIDRGNGCRFRAAVPYDSGPDAAAAAVVAKANKALQVRWAVVGPALTLDGGNRYAYPVADPAIWGLNGAAY